MTESYRSETVRQRAWFSQFNRTRPITLQVLAHANRRWLGPGPDCLSEARYMGLIDAEHSLGQVEPQQSVRGDCCGGAGQQAPDDQPKPVVPFGGPVLAATSSSSGMASIRRAPSARYCQDRPLDPSALGPSRRSWHVGFVRVDHSGSLRRALFEVSHPQLRYICQLW